MIADLIVQAFLGLISNVIGLLPNAGSLSIPDLTGWVPFYSFADQLLPVHEGLQMGALVVGVRLAIFAVQGAAFVWHLIPKPFSGT